MEPMYIMFLVVCAVAAYSIFGAVMAFLMMFKGYVSGWGFDADDMKEFAVFAVVSVITVIIATILHVRM